MTKRTDCAASATSCGTASGWRQGGRCPRCRAAHNAETNRYRSITPDQRVEVLRLLRSGKDPKEAAAAIGRSAVSLSQLAATDGELRAALDGEPLGQQIAAHRGDYLAALVRLGTRAEAARQVGEEEGAAEAWRRDPAWAAAEDALLAWLREQSAKARKAHTKATEWHLERAAELLESGRTLAETAEEIGLSLSTLRLHRARNERLAAAWARVREPGRAKSQARVKVAEQRADRAADLLKGRAKLIEVCEQLGVTAPTIYDWAVRHARLGAAVADTRAARLGSKLTPQREQVLREMWEAGARRQDIAEELGVSVATVNLWRRRLGLPLRQKGRPAG